MKLFALMLLVLSTQAFAGSPIIWTAACAYNLKAGACVPTGSGSGFDTIGAFGSSPDAKGASSSGTTITMQPADATHPGMVTTGSQTIAGNKTFNGNLQFSGNPTYFGVADPTVVANASPDFLFNTGTANHTVAIFTGPTTTAHGALAFITVANGDFYVQATASNDGTGSAPKPLKLNPQGGRVVLGSAAGLVELKGYSDGNLSVASEVIVSSSDARLKDKQDDFKLGLDAISKINPVVFKWKKELPQGRNGASHVGFFAQNVEKAIPLAVSSNGGNGMKSLDDRAIIAALVNANKELLKRVEALEARH